ncbi:MAG: hypothetical protein AABY04_00675 [Candidatus Micrarchaeota archaeon]
MGFAGRVIKVGNGVAIATTKEVVEQNKWKMGQKIEWVPLNKKKKDAMKRLFGSHPDLPSFAGEEESDIK